MQTIEQTRALVETLCAKNRKDVDQIFSSARGHGLTTSESHLFDTAFSLGMKEGYNLCHLRISGSPASPVDEAVSSSVGTGVPDNNVDSQAQEGGANNPH